MAITASKLASKVLTDHIALFPDAIGVYRENAATGVPRHVPIEAFIEGLTGGVVAAVASARFLDIGSGTDDVNGTSNPRKFTLPGRVAAETNFLTASGWNGDAAGDVVSVFIGSTLEGIELYGRLVMDDNLKMGTGTSHVRASANPNLEVQLSKVLAKEIKSSFRATGKFAEGDVPGNIVNKALRDSIQLYADALALGLASMVATVKYTGVGGGISVQDIVNTGRVV